MTLNQPDTASVRSAQPEWVDVAQSLPPPYAPIVYRTEFYQFSGFRNEFGDWFMADGFREKFPVLQWRDSHH